MCYISFVVVMEAMPKMEYKASSRVILSNQLDNGFECTHVMVSIDSH